MSPKRLITACLLASVSLSGCARSLLSGPSAPTSAPTRDLAEEARQLRADHKALGERIEALEQLAQHGHSPQGMIAADLASFDVEATPLAPPAAMDLAGETAGPVPFIAPRPEPFSQNVQTTSVFSALHLASYRQASTAAQGWRSISSRFGDSLGNAEPRLVSADLGEKGVFLRLIAGPFEPAAADALCGRLEAQGQYCKPAAFAGEPLADL